MIEMVSLQKQLQNYETEIQAAIQKVLNSTLFIQGETVKTFEKEFALYLNQKHVISCANGTDALQLALMAINLKPADEVIIPAFSYVSPAETTALLGAKIIFVDVNEDDYLINTNKLKEAINSNTKAIIPVHLFGAEADVNSIENLIKGHQITIIEDAAQSVGNIINSRDSIICTSFFPTKNLGCYGDGGAVITNNQSIAEKIRALANHGQHKKYEHQFIGINSRLDALHAAILSVKLKNLDKELQQRRRIADIYLKELQVLSGLKLPSLIKNQQSCWHQFTVQLPTAQIRNNFQKHLAKADIASAIYYPKPLHLQKAYQYLGYKKGDFPVAERLSETVISLPVHPFLTDQELEKILQTIKNFIP